MKTNEMIDLYTILKQEIINAILAQDHPRKDILRVVIGELDNIKAKGELTHDQTLKVIRKIVEANNEILKINKSDKLLQENQILSEFLPNTPTVEEIVKALENVTLGNNIGKATGIAVKYLREHGIHADGRDVRAAIERLVMSGENTNA